MSHEKYKLVKQINQIHGTQLDSEIREKQKMHYRFNTKIITEGYNFAKSGLTLDDASEAQRNEPNFVFGFEKYMRELDIADEFYRRGSKAFIEGVNWETIPEIERENEAFVQGFEDAMTMSTKKHR